MFGINGEKSIETSNLIWVEPTSTRNRRIDHYMHTASKRIIALLVKEGIGVLCIGKNDGWKQEANLGKRTNQNFVQIPHARFIAMLTYKTELVGIRVEITEESYTSKASLLDLDPLPVRTNGDEEKHTFSGKRVKRGLYRASDGRYVNADINGSGNIIRKVAPDAFSEARVVEDGKGMLTSLVVHPVRVVIPRTKPKNASDRLNAIKRLRMLRYLELYRTRCKDTIDSAMSDTPLGFHPAASSTPA